jgi:hypothetical protein
MMERTLMALAAAAAIAAAAAVGVVALAFALYATMLPLVGPAWAACIVAAAAALLVALAALVAARKAEGDHHRRQQAAAAPEAGLVDVVLNLVRDRPLIASGAAVAAGIYALRNPQLIAAVLRAFMDKPSSKT